ncbi:MAG: hypothetical protein ACSLE4_11450 [Methyloceanibacter sp.]|uniref:hypothetical protein n=1 Tax=Methyloceanibacter sp. TaxID=1965321 RepID=UPI003EDEF918
MAAADVVPRHGPAAAACRAAGDGEPGEIVTAVDDGRGGSLVWLTDADTNLWLCSADERGSVYAYGLIFEDLLRGAGAAFLPPVSVDRGGKPVLPADPLGIAQVACRAYLDDMASAVLNSGPDGLEGGWIPGYFVFLETKAGDTFLCNATPNAQVWVFARIGAPLRSSAPVG